jgi:hypothetical protein
LVKGTSGLRNEATTKQGQLNEAIQRNKHENARAPKSRCFGLNDWSKTQTTLPAPAGQLKPQINSNP